MNWTYILRDALTPVEQTFLADVSKRADESRDECPEMWRIEPEDIDKLLVIIERLSTADGG